MGHGAEAFDFVEDGALSAGVWADQYSEGGKVEGQIGERADVLKSDTVEHAGFFAG